MRLIDADALRKKSQWMEMPDHQGINFDVRAVSVSSIDIAQTIDAVPVVRCKGCRFYEHGVCELHSEWPDQYSTGHLLHMAMDDFCSYGERKEG